MGMGRVVVLSALIAGLIAAILTYALNVIEVNSWYARYLIVLSSVFISMMLVFRMFRNGYG